MDLCLSIGFWGGPAFRMAKYSSCLATTVGPIAAIQRYTLGHRFLVSLFLADKQRSFLMGKYSPIRNVAGLCFGATEGVVDVIKFSLNFQVLETL